MDVIEMSGKTYEGRPIKGVRINPGNSKKKIFVDSGIHAREWIAPSTVAYLINQLATNRSLNEDIINAFDWYLFPVLNPDGYEYTFSKDRLWRKNRNPEISRTCPGIDLNRNWDYHWGEDVRGKDPCTELYAGPSPFSEPETQAIRDFLANLNADGSLALIVSFHSYVQVLMSPWSHTYAFPDDYSDLLAVMHATDLDFVTSIRTCSTDDGDVSGDLDLEDE
ncbi:unnamed protein product [Cyprideis torosa]|uniref:Peptidase M14 domain-containing protein n=1 Tax=Cyprideis torosa TaxID=163714 RepID=A0A7R8W567_9CRUS|nr:unnamed protein product [Cyprideis torosa]CAG0884908.1 unnamed protein product [Cyprideis torosa]